MSDVAKTRLLRTLLDLREEASKLERMADNGRDADYAGQAKGIGFAIDEITAALRIQGEECWTSEVDQASAEVFGGAA